MSHCSGEPVSPEVQALAEGLLESAHDDAPAPETRGSLAAALGITPGLLGASTGSAAASAGGSASVSAGGDGGGVVGTLAAGTAAGAEAAGSAGLASAAAAGGSKTATLALAAKWVLGSLALTSAGLGTMTWVSSSPDPRPSASSQAADLPHPTAEPKKPARADPARPPQRIGEDPSQEQLAAGTATAMPPPPPQPRSTTDGSGNHASQRALGAANADGSRRESVLPVLPLESAVGRPNDPPPPSASVDPARGESTLAGPTPVSTGAADKREPTRRDHLASEVQLLDTARSQLSANPQAALATLQQYHAQFPRGTLQAEALALTVEAQLRGGNQQAAHQWLRRLQQAYPHSHQLERFAPLRDARPHP